MQPKDMLILCTLVILTTLACSFLAPSAPSTPTPRETTAPSTAKPPTTTPTAAATATPTAMPTPSPTPTPAGAVCPPPGSPELIEPANFPDYPATIRQFLSAGGSMERLREQLTEWNALPAGSGLDGEESVPQVVSVDLTGDEVSEVVVAVINPNAQVVTPPPGDLFVFGCEEGTYTRLYRHGIEDEEFGPTMLIHTIADMTEDGLTNLAYIVRSCGAHTCFETLQILGWDGDQFVRLMGGELTMPYPAYTVTPGQIKARSGGIGSAGAEPQRPYTETWIWTGSLFTVTEMVYAPPTYRYHALLDGERALLEEDYETALASYETVIESETLEEWGETFGVMTPEEERATLSAFARWRMVVTQLLMGSVNDAQVAYNQLQTRHPPDTPGHDVAVMGETFWNTYLEHNSLTAGCEVIVAEVDEDDTILQFFNQNYGYANPWWEPQDLCPFVE